MVIPHAQEPRRQYAQEALLTGVTCYERPGVSLRPITSAMAAIESVEDLTQEVQQELARLEAQIDSGARSMPSQCTSTRPLAE